MASSALPPQQFTLDRTIFNETLYTSILTFWFTGLPEGCKRNNEISMKRWWGFGASEEEKATFDAECKTRFGAALESIAPDKLSLPPFKGYEEEGKIVQTIAKPFLDEVKRIQQTENGTGDKNAADTYLSLLLLLDQLSRNTHRSHSQLPTIYTHYDRLAWSLHRSAPSLTPNPMHHPSFSHRPVLQLWFGLPLMHAEDLPSAEEQYAFQESLRREAETAGDVETAEDVRRAMGPGRKHLEIVRRFGRYPHRNLCLGRESTGEEREWLKTGETFGVKQTGQGGEGEGKDEL